MNWVIVMALIQEITEDLIVPSSDLLSDEPQMETYLHLQQMILLLKCLEWRWRDQQDFFAAGNLTIYYSPRQRKSEHFRGPDFFVVLDVERKPRKSWVVWEEGGKYPNVIVEILSTSTAETDKGLKKQIYQDIFRTPDYFWFDPETLEFQGFELMSGQYQAIEPNENGWLWSQQLGLYLGLDNDKGWLWSQQLGLYLGIDNDQLRFFTPEGKLVLTPEETAELLAEKLQELGINPDEIS